MKEKVKNAKLKRPRINAYLFYFLWVSASFAAMALGAFLQTLVDVYALSNIWVASIVTGLYLGIPLAILQKLLLYLHFGHRFKGWISITMLGWILTTLCLAAARELNGFIQLFVLIFIPVLAQAWILRLYTQDIWRWLLVTSIGVVIASGLIEGIIGSPYNYTVATIAYAAITGLTLLWVLRRQRDEIKLKTDHLEDKSNTETFEIEEVQAHRQKNRDS